MNPSAVSVASQIPHWASRQLADYDARHPGTMFAEGVVLEWGKGMNFKRPGRPHRKKRSPKAAHPPAHRPNRPPMACPNALKGLL